MHSGGALAINLGVVDENDTEFQRLDFYLLYSQLCHILPAVEVYCRDNPLTFGPIRNG